MDLFIPSIVLDVPTTDIYLNSTLPVKQQPVYVTLEEYKRYSYILSWITVFGHPITGVCLLISARVFLVPRLYNYSTAILVALNLAEGIYSVLLTPYQICKLTESCAKSRGYRIFTLYTAIYLGTVLRRSVFVLYCFVSVQRFVVTAFPIRSRSWRALYFPKLMCTAIFLSMILMYAYIPVKYEVKHKGNNYIIVEPGQQSEIFHHFTEINLYVTTYLPLLISVMANIGLVHSLYIHTMAISRLNVFNSDNSLFSSSNIQYEITIIISATSVFFFVFALPDTVNYIVGKLNSHYGPRKRERFLYQTLQEGFVLCQLASDLVTFLSYLLIGPHFRNEFFKLMFCGRKNDQQKDSLGIEIDMRQKMNKYMKEQLEPSSLDSWKDPRISLWINNEHGRHDGVPRDGQVEGSDTIYSTSVD